MFEKYRIKKEVQKRINPLKADVDKIDYLHRMLRKKKLLSPQTGNAVYSALGDLYLKKFKEDDSSYGKRIVYQAFEPLLKSIEAYARAGEINKARRLLKARTNKVHVHIMDDTTGKDKERYITLKDFLENTEFSPSDFAESYADLGERRKGLVNLIEKEKLKRQRGKRFEKYFPVSATIIGIVGGIFFLSSNITGNVIGSRAISNGIGAVLLIVGLVAGFFWVKAKKK